MGHMLQDFTDGLGHAVRPHNHSRHNDHGGTFSADLAGVPVLMSYEMTILGPEVIEVSINDSALIPAGYIDAKTRKGWERDIERSRDSEGFIK